MNGFSQNDLQSLDGLKKDLAGRFIYIIDKDQYGVSEYWEDHQKLKEVVEHGGVLVSDCEGYAMAVMLMAAKIGFPARLVFCQTERGEGHCICEVASRDKTQAVYFDNRFLKHVGRAQLEGYRFLRVSPWDPVSGDTRPWLSVDVNKGI